MKENFPFNLKKNPKINLNKPNYSPSVTKFWLPFINPNLVMSEPIFIFILFFQDQKMKNFKIKHKNENK